MPEDRLAKIEPASPASGGKSGGGDQLALFADENARSDFFVFVDIDTLDESSLFRLMAMNAVSFIIDMRPAPIFGRPKFKHSDVTSYFYSANVGYFEYAFKMKDLGDALAAELNRALGRKARGMTLCLFDKEARERGICEHARKAIKHSELLSVELSPRAIAGV